MKRIFILSIICILIGEVQIADAQSLIGEVFMYAPKRKVTDPISSRIVIYPQKNENEVAKVTISKYGTDYKFHDGMLAVLNKENGLIGFVSKEGKLLKGGYKWLPPSTNTLPKFGAGAVIVSSVGGKDSYGRTKKEWYILDKAGNTIKLKYDIVDATPFNEDGVAAIIAQSNYTQGVKYINTKGVEVYIGLSIGQYNYAVPEIGAIRDGLAKFYDTSNKKYGYIDKQGKIVIPAQFIYAEDFSEGLAVVQKDYKYYFINPQGEQAFDKQFSNRPLPFKHGYSGVKKTNKKCVYINKQGEVCSDEYYNLTSFYPNGIALVQKSNNVNERCLTSINTDLVEIGNAANYGMGIQLGDKAPEYFNGIFFGNGTFYDYKGLSMHIQVGGYETARPAGENLIHINCKNNGDGFIEPLTGKYILVFEEEEF